MPDYGFYIWASYSVTAVIIGGFCILTLVGYIKARKTLNMSQSEEQ